MCGGGPLPGSPTTSTSANCPPVSLPVVFKATNSLLAIQTDLPSPGGKYATPFLASSCPIPTPSFLRGAPNATGSSKKEPKALWGSPSPERLPPHANALPYRIHKRQDL